MFRKVRIGVLAFFAAVCVPIQLLGPTFLDTLQADPEAKP